MDNRMLDRIVIIILLLLNLFLVAVGLTDRAEARRSDAETREYVVTVLADNGIAAAEDAILVQAAPVSCTLVRNNQKEAEIIRSLLGKTSAEDQGGNIMFYRNDKGQALFRGSGELTVLCSYGDIPKRGGAEKTALRLMRRAGVEMETVRVSETDGTADFYCCWNGYPVYNAVLSFDYYESSLYMLSGIRLFDNVTEETDTDLMDSVSALMRFIEIANSEGLACSRLDGIRPGYLQSVMVSGESTLTPVWRMETDAGVFLINAETGKIENISA